MSTLVTPPSMVMHVRPRINGIFIFFMLLPLMTAAALFAAAFLTRKWHGPIPVNALDLMSLAREETKIPMRKESHEMYPQVDIKKFKLQRKLCSEEDHHDEEHSNKLAVCLVPIEEESASLPEENLFESAAEMEREYANPGDDAEITVAPEQTLTPAAKAHEKPVKDSPDHPAYSAQDPSILVADYSYQSKLKEESPGDSTRAIL